MGVQRGVGIGHACESTEVAPRWGLKTEQKKNGVWARRPWAYAHGKELPGPPGLKATRHSALSTAHYPPPMPPHRHALLAVIGGGNMGKAIVLGALDAKLLAHGEIVVCEEDPRKRDDFARWNVR